MGPSARGTGNQSNSHPFGPEILQDSRREILFATKLAGLLVSASPHHLTIVPGDVTTC